MHRKNPPINLIIISPVFQIHDYGDIVHKNSNGETADNQLLPGAV